MNILLDPNVAYFLLVAGFVMAVLALFSPGTGFIEIGAFFALALAAYGIINLPINTWALAVLLAGVFPFVLALRQSKQYIYLGVALAALIVGSIFLFRSEGSPLAVNPFLASLVSVLAMGLMWIIARTGLSAMRLPLSHDLARFIGEIGEARSEVHLEGAVYVGGEEWTARSNVLIPAGSRVKIVGRKGLVLLVEPLQPAAAE
ncbi:MAG: NfeD family protein [Anaerolineaceae bacterium]|jgi:membrane-bound serine protease (ClpP class)